MRAIVEQYPDTSRGQDNGNMNTGKLDSNHATGSSSSLSSNVQ
jgi:hypothetical protein